MIKLLPQYNPTISSVSNFKRAYELGKKEFEKDRKMYLSMIARLEEERDEAQEGFDEAVKEVTRLRNLLYCKEKDSPLIKNMKKHGWKVKKLKRKAK